MKILVWEVRTSKGFTLMELSKKSGIGTIAIALEVKITDLFESEYK